MNKTGPFLVFILFLILADITKAQTVPMKKENSPSKPNIVLIMADDIGWEAIGCYGSQDYKTPNIDRLAKKGIQFAHCYSTPICTTSRVKIMTGQYNFRNYTHFGYLHPNQKTFGHLLQDAGYKTAIAGKWQLNGRYNKMPRHMDSSRPQEAGFDQSLLWQVTTGKGTSPNASERFWNPALEKNGKFLTKEENKGKYGPDLFCDFICKFIEDYKKEPFFVYYPMVLVHNPFVPTPDSLGNRPKSSANRQPKSKKKQKENFAAMVQYMDKIVGRIERKLEETGQLENTLILFTADNGTNKNIVSNWNNQKIRGGKAGMTDTGTHVPLVAYWKGKTPIGKVCNDLIDFSDFLPTFADLADSQIPDDYPGDGQSFLPQIFGKKGNPRDFVVCHYQPYWNKRPGQFVRNDQFKLYRDGRFFDIQNDLHEKSSLSDKLQTESQKIRKNLQSILNQLPPVPYMTKGRKHAGRNTEKRPTYPNWKNVSSNN